MNANTWFYIGIVSFALAIAFALLSIVIFVKLKIREVFNDITGKNVSTGIQNLKKESKIKEIKRSNSRMASANLKAGDETETTILSSGDETETTILSSGDETETTILSSGDETETTILSSGDETETTILSSGDETETTILCDEKVADIRIDNTIIIHG